MLSLLIVIIFFFLNSSRKGAKWDLEIYMTFVIFQTHTKYSL